MGALTQIEANVLADEGLTGVLRPRPVGSWSSSRRTGRPDPRRPVVSLALVGDAEEPCSSSMTAARRLAAGPASRAAAAPGPLRLTRRGRVVLGSLIVMVVTVAALLISLIASGGAQATNHGRPGGAFHGMHQIVVQPGQTLWSIASAAEPSADPRSVVEQMMSVNALSSTTISAGEELWVPR